ncbi:pilus assembly protein PilM [candidate division KSB1 bacterium]
MADTVKDKKELATNRLLEVLRGEVEDVEDVDVATEEAPVQLGLSDEERDAFSPQRPEIEKRDFEEEPKKEREIPFKWLFDKALELLNQFILPKTGIIGIKFGTYTIKYVYCEKKKNSFILKDAVIKEISEETAASPEDHIASVRDIIEELIPEEIRKKSAFATMARGSNVSIKKVSLPKMGKNEFKEAIAFSARKDLPFEAESTLFDHKVLGEITEKGIEKTEVLVSIIDNKLLNRHLELYNELDIETEKVLSVPMAIYENFKHFVENKPESSSAVIDIGTKVSNIIFIHDGNLQFAREIAFGGHDITKSIIGTISTTSGIIKIGKNEARDLKREYGVPEEGSPHITEQGISLNQLSSLMRPSLERLATQIQRSLDYYRSKFPYGEPDKIYLTGGTAQMKHFNSYFAEALGKEVEVLNPISRVIVDPKLLERTNVNEIGPSLATTMGMIFSDQQGINLLPFDLKMKPVYNKYAKYVSLAAAFVLTVISFMSFTTLSGSGSVESELLEKRRQYNEMDISEAKRMFDADINRLQLSNNQFMQQIELLSGGLVISDYLKLLSTLKPEYISLNSMSISTVGLRIMHITGFVAYKDSHNKMALIKYTDSIKNSGMFINVSSPEYLIEGRGQSPAGIEMLPFRIQCVM